MEAEGDTSNDHDDFHGKAVGDEEKKEGEQPPPQDSDDAEDSPFLLELAADEFLNALIPSMQGVKAIPVVPALELEPTGAEKRVYSVASFNSLKESTSKSRSLILDEESSSLTSDDEEKDWDAEWRKICSDRGLPDPHEFDFDLGFVSGGDDDVLEKVPVAGSDNDNNHKVQGYLRSLSDSVSLILSQMHVDDDNDADFLKAVQLSMKDMYSTSSWPDEPASSSNSKPSEEPLGELCSRCAMKEPLRSWPECGHLMCDHCMVNYLLKMMREQRWMVKCPREGCIERITAEECWGYLPPEVGDRWIQAIEEATNLQNPGRYFECPRPNCAAKVFDDRRGFKIKACIRCRELFCTVCRSEWHAGMTCEDYQAVLRVYADD